ncbi:MAG: hypothetical protein QNJ15_13975 [Erythrobacter sp.]|nr:hypothetical protein [Erythrobacter sp.]
MLRIRFLTFAIATFGAFVTPASLWATDYTQLALEYCADLPLPSETAKPGNLSEILEAERGTHSESEVLVAMVKSAAIDIARAADSKESCEDTLARGRSRFEKILKQFQKQMRKKKHRLSRDPEIRSIQKDIIDLWVTDQSSRSTYIALQTEDRSGADYWAQRLSVAYSREADEQSRTFMKKLLGEWDWIDRKRFGSAVSDHAWILVQHADADPEFQAMVLDRMKPFLDTKGIRPKHYAYLWDRVAVNTGRKQRYGTQPDWQCNNGKMQLKPLEDRSRVNEWRASMGLNTVEAGLAEMERNTCR